VLKRMGKTRGEGSARAARGWGLETLIIRLEQAIGRKILGTRPQGENSPVRGERPGKNATDSKVKSPKTKKGLDMEEGGEKRKVGEQGGGGTDYMLTAVTTKEVRRKKIDTNLVQNNIATGAAARDKDPLKTHRPIKKSKTPKCRRPCERAWRQQRWSECGSINASEETRRGSYLPDAGIPA